MKDPDLYSGGERIDRETLPATIAKPKSSSSVSIAQRTILPGGCVLFVLAKPGSRRGR